MAVSPSIENVFPCAGYRSSGGDRSSVLPDFFIGAHAAVLDVDLLTRDVGRYRTCFPTLRLITPDIG
jgi:predicted nucleic acid-binding protein